MLLRQLLIFSLLLSGCATLKQGAQPTFQTPQFSAQDQIEFELLNSESPSLKKNNNLVTKKPSKTGQYNPTKNQSYVGVKGYLNRPPVFTDSQSEKVFQRCQSFEISGVYQTGQTILIHAKQNGNHFAFSGINRKSFIAGKSKRLPLLDQHLVSSLSNVNHRNVASTNQKVCAGQTWTNMPREQFLFVTGDPETRQPLSTERGQFDVWTYVGQDPNQPRHYYFQSGKLYSWTK